MKKARVGALFAAVSLLSMTSARADVFDFTIVSARDSAMGQFVATGGPTNFQVTSISGTVDGVPIMSLSGYGLADNMLFQPSPFVDRAGTAFTTGTLSYNIFTYTSGVALYGFCSSAFEPSCVGGEANGAPSALFTVTAAAPPAGAPAPLAGAGLLSFFGAGGVAMRKRAKHVIGSLLSRRWAAA